MVDGLRVWTWWHYRFPAKPGIPWFSSADHQPHSLREGMFFKVNKLPRNKLEQISNKSESPILEFSQRPWEVDLRNKDGFPSPQCQVVNGGAGSRSHRTGLLEHPDICILFPLPTSWICTPDWALPGGWIPLPLPSLSPCHQHALFSSPPLLFFKTHLLQEPSGPLQLWSLQAPFSEFPKPGLPLLPPWPLYRQLEAWVPRKALVQGPCTK